MEPQLTMMIGNVAQDVRHVKTQQGVPITTFRMASTRRQYDRAQGRWVDAETTFVNVTCWRALADHVLASVSKGDPIVVVGRLRVRSWEREGYKGTAVEIDAFTVGHDLTRGTSAFRRVQPRSSAPPPEREVADDLLMSMEAAAEGPEGPGPESRQDEQRPGEQGPDGRQRGEQRPGDAPEDPSESPSDASEFRQNRAA